MVLRSRPAIAQSADDGFSKREKSNRFDQKSRFSKNLRRKAKSVKVNRSEGCCAGR